MYYLIVLFKVANLQVCNHGDMYRLWIKNKCVPKKNWWFHSSFNSAFLLFGLKREPGLVSRYRNACPTIEVGYLPM